MEKIIDQEQEVFIPPEVEKFVISDESMKEMLGKKLDTQVRAMETDGGEVLISLPESFLNKIVEANYGRNIESLRVNEESVEIDLAGDQPDDGEQGSEEDSF